MIGLLGAYPVQLLAVFVLGAGVHEGTHYVACRLAGAPARLTYTWGAVLPVPAIETDLFAHTPLTHAAAALAPTIVLLPSLAAFALADPTGQTRVLAAVWCGLLIPSLVDWQAAYNAGDVRELHAVAEGPHPDHQTAEGIA